MGSDRHAWFYNYASSAVRIISSNWKWLQFIYKKCHGSFLPTAKESTLHYSPSYMQLTSWLKYTPMSSTITIPTSVTCMENVKIASLGQNHFFRSVLNSHLLLQLIYFKLFHFCRIWFKFVFTHNPLWVRSFSQIINFELKSRNNNILYYMEVSISSLKSTGTLKTDFLPLFYNLKITLPFFSWKFSSLFVILFILF